MKVMYIRVSTVEQNEARQLEQTKDPHIQEKLKHYIYGLNKDEERILQVLNKGDNKK